MTEWERIRVFSFGGGVQSTAALVLAAHGRIPHRTFLFSNVGDDSESRGTLVYVEEHARPYAARHGLELTTLHPTRFKKPETLLALLTDEKRMSLTIPVRGTDGGPVVPRSCTRDFKIRVVDRELARRGATKENPAVTGLGITTDEYTRATNRPGEHHVVEYPLAMTALAVLDAAVKEHRPSHVFALFSGGHDSLAALAVAAQHPAFAGAVHINTGIGIAETREFVRETCRVRGWPLLEYHPDAKTYRDLVIEKGMPAGPKAHSTTYYWLKQRQMRRLVAEHKEGRHGRIVLVTGVRASESVRRMAAAIAVPVRRTGAQVWVNPILDWSALDCSRLIAQEGLARNLVTDTLHRSGECLCGAMAHWSELREIELFYPAAAAEIRGYEALAREHGHLEDVWARRLRGVSRAQTRIDMPLCVSCEARP